MTGCIAVLNAGSSSIKFALYEAGATAAAVPRPGRGDRRRRRASRCTTRGRRSSPSGAGRRTSSTIAARRAEILKLGRELLAGRPVLAFGHRVVHGGTNFAAPVRVDAERAGGARQAGAAGAAAPAAQSGADRGDRRGARPHLPQVACFDTAFHRTQPRVAQAFALPRDLTASGVRRYGFHGLSYEYIVSAACTRSRRSSRAVAAGRRPSRQRRQPVRRRTTAAAWPAPWASPPSTG